MSNNSTKSIRGTKTEVQLANAFMAESAAYSRYTFFGQSAKKEQYFEFANIFDETAANELHHAKIFLKYLKEGGATTAPLGVDAGVLSPTVDNLAVAAHEEEVEGVEAYTNAAKIAEEEGFDDIASHFRAIATIEDHHRRRFLSMEKHIKDGTVWKREKPIEWVCLVCGYVYKGTEPPAICPACNHPYQHYKPLREDYDYDE